MNGERKMERMVKIEKVMVKEFVTHNHSFAICKDNEGNYWGFDCKFIDDSGRLTKQFNGITGHREKTMIETMRRCYQTARTENEIDREKLKANDLDELMKLSKIIDESYKEIA